MVTEWIEGEQLAKSPPEVISRLTKVGIECFLTQLLETGFFHADPHPGNLLVTPEGKLGLIDFGLCAEVPLPDTKVVLLLCIKEKWCEVRGWVRNVIVLIAGDDAGAGPPDAGRRSRSDRRRHLPGVSARGEKRKM